MHADRFASMIAASAIARSFFTATPVTTIHTLVTPRGGGGLTSPCASFVSVCMRLSPGENRSQLFSSTPAFVSELLSLLLLDGSLAFGELSSKAGRSGGASTSAGAVTVTGSCGSAGGASVRGAVRR